MAPAAIASAVEGSSDPTDKTLVIRQVTPDIVTFSVPFSRAGMIPIGGRSTAIRLPSGIFVYASTPCSVATKKVLESMGGDVKWLVTPDGEHSMYISEYVEAYPTAKPIGVTRVKDKKPDIQWAGLFGSGGENQQYGFEPDITLHQVSAHTNHELTAIHHPSQTLLQADLLFNLPPNEQYSRAGGIPGLFKLFGGGKAMSPGTSVHSAMATGVLKDKELFKKEVQPILAAKWQRIIPCHGDVIETNGRAEWDKVWAKYQ